MVQVRFYDTAADELLKFAVIAAKFQGRWVFCRHKDRVTWEIPGGHREPGESIEEAARRELQEETGAVEYHLEPIGIYSVTRDSQETFGMLYAADIFAFDDLRHEIGELLLTDTPPRNWTYPLIQPELLGEALRRGY